MADKTFSVKIQMRVDTESAWLASDPVLMLNELIFSTEIGDNKEVKMKLGDGTKKFSELSYLEMGGSGGEIEFPVSSVNGMTGNITLTASDVDALPSSTTYVSSINSKSGAVTIAEPPSIVLSSTQPTTQTVVGSLWLKQL